MQFPAFIDNRDENRQFDRVINHIIFPYIREMRIAVGYFYLSGFELVMDSLENNEFFQKNDVQIKFLISPRTDYTTAKVLETAFKIP
ncbi:MAG: hypothetical protein KDK45_25675, partial [Leptospiraceae bacterium]|nr:hypothetical protein [Leptospiraceae bacterium]